jgi:hypothetical protein
MWWYPKQVWLQEMILGLGNWREFAKGFAVGGLRLPIPLYPNRPLLS